MSPELGAVTIAGVAAVVTFAVTFGVRRVAVGRRLVVPPDPERVHSRPTPTAGGAGIAIGFVIALLVASQLGVFHDQFTSWMAPEGVILAVVVMAVVGLVDDVRNVSPPAKVAGQVLAAMVLYFFGVTMTQIKVPILPGYIVLGAGLLPLVTAIWVVGIANAVNLIDGLDGLAAGVVAIGSGTLCIYGLRLVHLGVLASNNIGPLLAAACCGVCIGFLPHNFYRAKIFMGDTGAMVLGLVMAAATMEIGGTASYVVSGTSYFFLAPLLVPIGILAIPLLDTVLAVVRRAVRRTGVTQRDLEHLHYRLMRLGHGHRRAVLLLWAWTFILSGLVLYPAFYPQWNGVLPFAVGAVAVGLVVVFRPGLGSGANGQRTPVAVGGAGSTATASTGSRPPASTAPRRSHRRRFARQHPPMRG